MNILELHDQRYKQSDWTVPNEPDTIAALDAAWESIKQEHPEFKPKNLHQWIARIYDASFTDSEIRQALFHRICEHYNVAYDLLYETWLEGGCDVRTHELMTNK